MEDDFALMNDFSIEKAVGLCEFRGREGIDSDFNTEGFLFEDSLWEKKEEDKGFTGVWNSVYLPKPTSALVTILFLVCISIG